MAEEHEERQARNGNLRAAMTAKQDEFYTQFEDIQKEINAYLEYNPDIFRDKVVLLPCDDPEWSNFTKFFAQNFEMLGLRKLISTSYAPCSKRNAYGDSSDYYQLTLFETESPQFDETLTDTHGKIFVLTREDATEGRLDINSLKWRYLDGDGDFRSEEVTKLRDEADFIVTNPPFSLFREFFKWIVSGNKKFLIIANQNAITYKDIFPLIKSNKVWLGPSIHSGDREFRVPQSYPLKASGFRVDENGCRFIRVKGIRWFTNIEHGRRHLPLSLMTIDDNQRFSKHQDIIGKGYPTYITFCAIDVPYYDAIPSDYCGIMGVPKSFMDFYCPEQFEIIGYESDKNVGIGYIPKDFLDLYRKQGGKGHVTCGMRTLCFIDDDGKAKFPFSRILIRYTKEWIKNHPEDFGGDTE